MKYESIDRTPTNTTNYSVATSLIPILIIIVNYPNMGSSFCFKDLDTNKNFWVHVEHQAYGVIFMPMVNNSSFVDVVDITTGDSSRCIVAFNNYTITFSTPSTNPAICFNKVDYNCNMIIIGY